MAANQTSNQRNKQGNNQNTGGQSATGQSSQRTGAGNESSGGAYGAIGDMAEQAQEYVSEGAEQVQECIREHSAASVMIALGAGFGIGILIGRAIAGPDEEPRSRRYRSMAEGFRSRLMDRIEAMIPDALAEHFSK